MQLPDESVEYDYRRLLLPVAETWTPLAELQAWHFLDPALLEQIKKDVVAVRGRVAAERELQSIPLKDQPLQPGFIDLPQKLLDAYRRRQDTSELGKLLRIAQRLREEAGRLVVLGVGGSYLGAKALIDALCHSYHNEMPAQLRLNRPRIYFEGYNVDNDTLHELVELLDNTLVDPEIPEERWALIVISKSGGTLETTAAFRVLWRELARCYGPKSELLRRLVVPITGPKGKLRDWFHSEGYSDDEILTIPEDIGGRYSVFTPVGLLPAAVVGLDVRALLQGAAAMTKRFLEESFERNPVLQFAAVNYLMTEQLGKPIRVLAVWSRKLEAIGWWYDQLLAESLGKQGRGATPITVVNTRDLHSRGQQHQEGARDKLINNLVVKSPRHPPVVLGMAEHNEDDLNQFSRKDYPDLLEAAFTGTMQAYWEAARPTADILLPTLNEYTLGQLLQMLMLATVVEGRLMKINPYGQPGVEAYKANMMRILKSTPNLPKGEITTTGNN
jgi:glucose-6-phosphate isomerase